MERQMTQATEKTFLSDESKDLAFQAFKGFMEVSRSLYNEHGEAYGPNEELFALIAAMVETAVLCGIPLSILEANLTGLYEHRTLHGAANDTSH
jgi:hypothetical protein